MADKVLPEPQEDKSTVDGTAAPRARRQLLLGILPLTVIAVVLLSVLAASLPAARAPLSAATETATAEVVRAGVEPNGLGVEVSFTDVEGREQSGTLVLVRPEEVPAGAEVGVQYDPDDPERVFAEGDAAHLTVRNLLFGLFWIGLVLLVCLAITIFRLL